MIRKRSGTELRKPAAVCPYLGEVLDDKELVYGFGCGKTKTEGYLTVIHECFKHEACAPLTSGTRMADESIVICRWCLTNPANQRQQHKTTESTPL
jgi:hypothetical protein